jgi:hypothetical protein
VQVEEAELERGAQPGRRKDGRRERRGRRRRMEWK